MDQIASSDLKTILHSKRANTYYLEHCRVLVNGGRSIEMAVASLVASFKPRDLLFCTS